MTYVIEQLNTFAETSTELIWAVVWQWTVLAVVVAALALLLRSSSPAVRYWLWQILLIKLLVMPFWVIAVPLPWLETAAATDSAADTAAMIVAGGNRKPTSPEAESESPSAPLGTSGTPGIVEERPLGKAATTGFRNLSWQFCLIIGWGAIVLAQCARIALQWFRLRQFLKQTVPASQQFVRKVQNAAADLKLQPTPRVVFTEADRSPFVCGVLDPVLVWPQGLSESLDETESRPVLLHELAHVQRRDLLWGWVSHVSSLIYFFHPVVHWVCRRLRLEQELACDQAAMAFSGQNAGCYAHTLVRVVSQQLEPPLQAAARVAGLDGAAGSPVIASMCHEQEDRPCPKHSVLGARRASAEGPPH